jgi:hypothetical protein
MSDAGRAATEAVLTEALDDVPATPGQRRCSATPSSTSAPGRPCGPSTGSTPA